eukprot:CAMPEP_0179976918 /NCGR_PEP_ID=MMETSP0983-20121128/39687_1 /TAXON_ID=483367 /ORGANISM="non described non described, Strain CCMP 2436" /LENGTH=88 /DNA_ID=CAMNT_0021893881 /DNA_START=30 /DNA_END=296 /DNA_ORIENTATION=+
MSARTAGVCRHRAVAERLTRCARWAFASRERALDVRVGGPLPPAPSTRAPRTTPPSDTRSERAAVANQRTMRVTEACFMKSCTGAIML